MRKIVMKNLNKIQKLTFEFDDIESIEEVGYRECIDIEIADDNSFTLANGIIVHNSACGGLMDGLGRSEMGYFATRGVPLNAYDAKVSKITENKELENLTKILNLRLGADTQTLTYENVVLANDADCFEEHTKVLTKRGNISLSDIQYGDECLTHNNRWKRVTNIIEREKNDFIKIVLNNNILYVSKNHKLPVIRDGKIQIIRAEDLKLTDYFLKKKI